MLVKTDQAAAVVSADDPGVFNGAICKGMTPTRLGKMTDQTADFSISLYCAVGHMDAIHIYIVAICVANYNTHLISEVLAIDGDVSAIKCKVLDCNRIFCRANESAGIGITINCRTISTNQQIPDDAVLTLNGDPIQRTGAVRAAPSIDRLPEIGAHIQCT